MTPACKDCRFWHKPSTGCRRNPPSVVSITREHPISGQLIHGPVSMWPSLGPNDFCHAFEARPVVEVAS